MDPRLLRRRRGGTRLARSVSGLGGDCSRARCADVWNCRGPAVGDGDADIAAGGGDSGDGELRLSAENAMRNEHKERR